MVTMAKDTFLVPDVVAARAVVDACKVRFLPTFVRGVCQALLCFTRACLVACLVCQLVGGTAEGQREGALAGEALPVDFRCVITPVNETRFKCSVFERMSLDVGVMLCAGAWLLAFFCWRQQHTNQRYACDSSTVNIVGQFCLPIVRISEKQLSVME